MNINCRKHYLASSLVSVASIALALQVTACSSDDNSDGGVDEVDSGAGSGGASAGGGGSSGAAGENTNGGNGGSGGSGGSTGGTMSGGADAGTNPDDTDAGADSGTDASDAGADSGDENDAGDSGSDACAAVEDLSPRTDVPDAIDVPAGTQLIHHFHAVGVQIYECKANPVEPDGGTPTYDWGTSSHASTPEALLYDSCNHAVIHHFGGPTWEWRTDTSKIVGAKLAAAAQTGTIAWLLLSAAASGSGELADVTYVQRLDTTGGTPPATGCDAEHEGDKVSIDYTANYYFYTGPDADSGS